MTTETLDREIRIFWARETAPRTVQADRGVIMRLGHLAGFLAERTGVSFDSPVLWDTVKAAAAWVTANPPGRPVDLHFPPLTRRQFRNPDEWMHDLTPAPIAPGVAYVRPVDPPLRRGYAESVLILAAAGEPAPDLCLTSGREGVSAAEASALLANYDLPELRDTGDQLLLTLRLPGSAFRAWQEAPRQATNRFYRAFTTVSRRIQQSLRAWLRYKWPADPRRWRDLVASYGSIMYWLSTPHKGRSHTEFTHDVLEAEFMKRVSRIAPGRFGAELDFCEQLIRQRGDLLAAHAYRSLHTREIMDAVRRERRTLTRYIASESEAVEAFVAYAAALAARGLGRLPDLATDLMTRLRSNFRSWPLDGAADWNATMTLMEATASLCQYLGRPERIRVAVHALHRQENSGYELPLAS